MTVHFQLPSDVDNYCVVGNPVKHSLSPRIHTLFASQTGQSLHYQSIEVGDGLFRDFVNRFKEQGGCGFNITVPYKTDAFAIANDLSERASRAQAVNTITITDKGLAGDNTDGIGLMRDIRTNLHHVIEDKRVLVLGAGGAVRGILSPLAAEHPKQLVIANRTQARAESLAEDFADVLPVLARSFTDLESEEAFDIVINGTAASLQDEDLPIPGSIFHSNSLSYDMMYSSQATTFQVWSKSQGVTQAVDGLGMLIEQAAEAFYIWRGVHPDTQSVIEDIRPA